MKSAQKIKLLRPDLHSAQLFYSTNHTYSSKSATQDAVSLYGQLALEVDELLKLEKTNYLNNDWLSQYFANWDSNTSDTPFKNILSIPNKSIIEKDSFGRLMPKRKMRYSRFKNNPDWAETDWVNQWKEALYSSVERSVEGENKVAIMLSSGIDSAGILAHLIKVPDIKVKAFSWRFTSARHQDADESKQIQAIVDFIGVDHEFIDIEDAQCFKNLDTWSMSPDQPYFNAMRKIKNSLYQRVAEQGYQRLLNGHLGDELAYVDRYYYSELIQHQPIKGLNQLFKQLLSQPNVSQDPAVRYVFKRLLKRSDKPMLYSHLSNACQQNLLLMSKGLRLSAETNFRKEQRAALISDSEIDALASESFYTGVYNIERRHPYLDEKLISLALACPAYLLSTPQHTKYLARKALKGMLPDNLIWSQRIGQLDSLFERGLTENKGHIKEFLFQENRLWPEFVQEEKVLKVLKNEDWQRAANVLVPCVGLERWLNVWREKEMPLQFEPFTH